MWGSQGDHQVFNDPEAVADGHTIVQEYAHKALKKFRLTIASR
jgi:hypothetical protein